MRLRVDVQGELPSLPITAEVRHHLFMSVKEAIHNAVVHSGGETVTLSLSVEKGRLEITVCDDGCGLPPDGGRDAHSHRLRNLRRRMEDIGGVCETGRSVAGGTTVRLLVPLASLGKTLKTVEG